MTAAPAGAPLAMETWAQATPLMWALFALMLFGFAALTVALSRLFDRAFDLRSPRQWALALIVVGSASALIGVLV